MARPPRKVVPLPGSSSALRESGPKTRDEIVDQRFEGERILVSGAHYERCRFIHCELVFDGRPVHLVDNSFEDCSWSFEGAAGDTLKFVAVLCQENAGFKMALARALGLTHEQLN